VAKNVTVKLTANFESNLETIAVFWEEVDAHQAFDRLLDDLSYTLIPNLESFPAMGRPLFGHSVGSVEVANAAERLQVKLGEGELREYLFSDYLVLYAQFDTVIHLLSIKHHRQLSFDFQSLWTSVP
jgi:hypothetical protein